MPVPLDIHLRRLDEHRIRVTGVGPVDVVVNGNGWEVEPSEDGVFAFNCMAFSNGLINLEVTIEGQHQPYHAFVSHLGIGETMSASIGRSPT